MKNIMSAAVAFIALSSVSSAALYTIDWGAGIGNAAYVADNAVVSVETNLTGTPASGFRQGGMATFDNDQAGGWLRFGQNVGYTELTTQGQLDGQYWTFTISANSGYTLDLSSLVFDARRATGNTATNLRGFEIWATTNGDAFEIGSAVDQRLLRVLSPTPDGLGNRTDGATPFNLDLSGDAFQGIESVSFRVYHLASDTTFNGIEFGDVVLDGTVAAIPEPSTALLGGLGILALLRRRRA